MKGFICVLYPGACYTVFNRREQLRTREFFEWKGCFVKRRKIVLGVGILCLLCAAVFWMSFHRSPDSCTDLNLLEDGVGAAAAVTLTCNSDSGNTGEFYLNDAAALSFYAENQADFEVEITLQKRDWRGEWCDIDINGEDGLIVSENGKQTIESGKNFYGKGTYCFKGTGSKGPSYDYAVTVSVGNDS